MPAEQPHPNTLTVASGGRSVTRGDVPENLRRRYYLDERAGPGLAFYVDATVKTPAFRDRGRQLVASRTDPNAIRDMMAIARHRGWTAVTARGGADFRREAWLAGRAAGLDVRGYRPTERDLQALGRKTGARDRLSGEADADRRRDRELDAGARSRLAVVEAVVRGRLTDRDAQDRIVARARLRLADWLERGARFDLVPMRAERQRPAVRDR